MRKLLLFLALTCAPLAAQAQPLAFGTLGAADQTVCTGTSGNQPLGQSASVNFQVTGTFTGTITFQGTSNQSLTLTSVEAANMATGTAAATTTTTGTYAVTNTGFLRLCATMTAYTNGTATVNITRGYGSGGSGGGGGGGGGDVNITEVAGTPIVGANVPVTCVSGCAVATSDADDGSIASGQTNSNANALGMVFDGSVWRRLTIGTAGTASAQVLTVQGVASMTPLLATVSDGAGALNTIVDSGTLTAVTTITNPVTVTDGAGALNTIVDSGTLTAVTSITNPVAVTLIANPLPVTGTLTNDGVASGATRVATMPGITENAAPTRTDGRNAALSLTTGGAARVMITNSAGAATSIATDQTLDAALGTTGPLMTRRGSAATPAAMSADNDTTAVWLTLTGAVHSAFEGIEDVAETAAAPLAMAGSVRRDTAASSATTTGDNATINTDSIGRLWTSAAVIEDVAETAAGQLIAAGSVRRDVAASSADTTGDNATVNTDALGQVWTRFLDPCSGVAKTVIPINIATATTTELTAALAGASNNYYVCSLTLVAAAAQTIALTDDDSDGCGSVTSGLAGGTTAATGFSFAANGGMTFGNGLGTIFKTNGTNRVICAVTGQAALIVGTITVVAAP